MHIFPGGQSLSEEQVFDKVFFFCVSITIVIVISIKKIIILIYLDCHVHCRELAMTVGTEHRPSPV